MKRKIIKKMCAFCPLERSPYPAILTIETALVLPLFLMCMLTLLALCSIYYVNGKVEAAVNEEAKLVALSQYDEPGYSTSSIEANIKARLSDRILNSSLIKGGENGFDFSDTDLSDREVLTIAVAYTVNLPFDIFSICEIPIYKKLIVHSWVGYERGLNGVYDTSEYVYMTSNGTVYHRSRECSHIRLSIRQANGRDIKNLRNENGGKYKKCIYCHPKLSDEKLYITEDGDKYHNTLLCSGLKRTIIRVKLSDIGDVKPCSRCGY